MARNTSVSLGDHFVDFVDEQVVTGRFGSVSDVVRAGLRLLEEQELRVQALRSALIAGEERGRPEQFDVQAFLRDKRATYSE